MTTPITPEELAAIKAQPHKSETVTRLLDEVEAMRRVVEEAVKVARDIVAVDAGKVRCGICGRGGRGEIHWNDCPMVAYHDAIDAYEARTEGEG